jgi:nucleotide-binding universal stress UspA family protein
MEEYPTHRSFTMKILLPVDGSDCTKRMIAHIAAQDEMFGSRHDYVMLLALDALPANIASLMDPEAIEEYCKQEVQRVFEPLRSFAAQNGWRVKFESASGDAGMVIAHYADREKPDLIVMGCHGRTALSNVVMGSVTTSVLARCKTPVLIIR